MDNARKAARLMLINSTRTQYQKIIYQAKLTPTQENIINLYILQDLPICTIADKLNMSEGGIRKNIAKVYDRISGINCS
jgi:predicted DNA-binding protein YlxM (UPF0122 family)